MSFKDQEILSTFLETPISEDMYSLEWRGIDANTNNDTHLKWDNSTLKSEWTSLKDSFITFDLTITGYVATRPICFKRSLLDFINSIQFSINGSSIINKANLEHYNYWRLLLDSSKAYSDSPDCEQIHFYPSAGNFGSLISTANSQPVGTYSAAVALNENSYVNKFDEGFFKKVVVLASYKSGSNYVVKCKIPLKMLHPFFSSDFATYPLNGFNLQLSVGHNKRKSEFNPFYDEAAYNANDATTIHNFTIGTDCKWWVRHIVFNSDQAVQVAKMMSSKFTKEIIYRDVEVGAQAGGSSIMMTTTAVLPQRVFFAQYVPAGILAQESEEPAITAEDNQPPSYNIEVNGIRYFHHDLENDVLQYQALQDACAQEIPDGAVPLLGFHDWRKFQKIQCVSLKRLKNRSSDPTALCNIKLTKSKANSTVYYAVEVQKTLKMSYDNGQVILLDASS